MIFKFHNFTFNFRWYEDLRCDEVDEFLLERINKGEPVNLPNGKLLERLLTIKMIRENVSQRSGYYGRQTQQRNKNPTTAMFIEKLIPIAQERIGQIRYALGLITDRKLKFT